MEEIQDYALELLVEAEGLASLTRFVYEAADSIDLGQCGEPYRKRLSRILSSLNYIATLTEQHEDKIERLIDMTYAVERVAKMEAVG